MEDLRFAVCIILPEATLSQLVKASLHYHVQILNYQTFQEGRDYNSYSPANNAQNGIQIFPLFIFPDTSILLQDESSSEQIRTRLKLYSNKS
jgi:hypothetical protein